MSIRFSFLCLILSMMLTACGGGGGGNSPPGAPQNPTYSIGGTITGLVGTGLILQNNSGDDLTGTANGSFTFDSRLTEGGSYNVIVSSHPSNPSQNCAVNNGSGVVGSENVTSVAIICDAPVTYTVGGNVTGMVGGGLVLQNNNGDDLTLSANGVFSFDTAQFDESAYSVTILSQPVSPPQVCSVVSGAGSVNGANVTNVGIICNAPDSYSVGGTVSGMVGSGMVLLNNNSDNLTVNADGNFTFTTTVVEGGSYNVTIDTAPSNPGQSCEVTNGSGVIGTADVVNIQVICNSPPTYTVSGSITGLTGSGLTLQLNNANNLAVNANAGSFAFTTGLYDGAGYSVTIFQQPTLPNARLTCALQNNSGIILGGNVTNVSIACITTYTVSVTVTDYLTGNTMVLRNNGGDDLSLTDNGVYTFNTGLTNGNPYSVSILTPSAVLKTTCTLANNIGTISGANITNVSVFCSDNISPVPVVVTPADAATNVALDTLVSAQFDENMLASSLETNPIELSSNTGVETGFSNYDALTRTVTFTPDETLSLLRDYNVRISSLASDMSGGRVRNNDRSWSFTTLDGSWRGRSLIEIDNAGNATIPQIAFDSAGNAIAVWQQSDGTYTNIWSNRFDVSSGTWGSAQLLEMEDLGNAENPQIAVDSAGNGIAVWQQRAVVNLVTTDTIWVNHYNAASGTWTGRRQIATDRSAGNPRITINPAGNAIVVWEQWPSGSPINVYARRYNVQTDVWGSSQLLENDSGQFNNARFPKVAMDAAGNAYAIWLQFNTGTPQNIWANRYIAASNSWSGPHLIEFTDTLLNAYDPEIAMDPAGNAMVVWSYYDHRLWYNRYTFNPATQTGSWGTQAAVSNVNNGTGPTKPQLAMDAQGNAQVVWSESDGGSPARTNAWTARYSGGAWSAETLLENDDQGNASFPDIALDPSGNGMAVWNQFDGTQTSIYASRYNRATNSWGIPQLLEYDDTGRAGAVQLGLDRKGRGIAIWQQRVGSLENIWANRFE